MSSERRVAANKRNAQQSRGPRTLTGKARVSRNALRHGLAVSILSDPIVCVAVDALARALVESEHDSALLAQARILAEAQLDLERIQVAKVRLMNLHLVGPPIPSPGAELAEALVQDNPTQEEGDEHKEDVQSHILGTAMVDIVSQLTKLHRYERRARSRFMQAMRNFSHLKKSPMN